MAVGVLNLKSGGFGSLLLLNAAMIPLSHLTTTLHCLLGLLGFHAKLYFYCIITHRQFDALG